MGLLDSILSGVLSGQQQPQATASGNILSTVINLVESQGGLQNIVNKFEQSGLKDMVGSWIGTGENHPVEASQIHDVFGKSQISDIAQKLGIPDDLAGSGIASLLPQLIDKLSPNGQLPQESNELEKGLESLVKSFLK